MGHRESGEFPCQLVVMVTRETDRVVRQLVDESGRSISDVLREVVAVGLPPTVRRDRRLRASLAEVATESQDTQPAA